MRLAPYDELEVIQAQIELILNDSSKTVRQQRDEISDIILELLIAAYLFGIQDCCELLGIEPLEPDQAAMQNTIYQEIDGKTFVDRVADHIPEEGNPQPGMLRMLAEAEITRCYNFGGIWAAEEAQEEQGQRIMKRWNTMGDERVRDTHVFLDQVEVLLDEAFFTFDGDSAMAPGGFTLPQNNAGCRCWLTYSWL